MLATKALTRSQEIHLAGTRSPRRLSCVLSLAFLATAGGSAFAQDLASEADAAQRARLAEAFVSEKLTTWQQHLGLADWKISIVVSRRSDLKPKTLGGIQWDRPKRTAVMRVLAASEYRVPTQEMLEDMELTVVHELIHLHLSSLPRSEASRRDEEHTVNQLAQALLKLDRRR